MNEKFSKLGFTLIELMVVFAIVAVVAALLFPVFSSAKKAAKRTDCLSNLKQIGSGMQIYLGDSDDRYPQTRQSSPNPAIQDIAGAIDEPIYRQVFDPIGPYLGNGNSSSSLSCPEDADPLGRLCRALDPDAPEVTSYLENAFFVFGLNQGSVVKPASTIIIGERRSDPVQDNDPYCDDIYHPWFSADNLAAPENDMDAATGAISTGRHLGLANYAFVDGHVKALHWAETYAPHSVNLHLLAQP